MATQPTVEDIWAATESDEQEAKPVALGGVRKIEEQYRKTKEHAETYPWPYVWGSYILVCGGFGLWLTYRWRKIRKSEDRVVVLHQRLQKLIEEEFTRIDDRLRVLEESNKQVEESSCKSADVAEKSVKSASLTNKPRTPSADKATK